MTPMFTPEELAEMAAFDAEVDAMELDAQDYRESSERDRDAVMAELPAEERAKKKQIAAYKREYRAANKEQIAAYQREYRAANKEQIAAYKREYYEANPDKYEKRKAKMREYSRRRYAAQKGKTHETQTH